MNTTFIAMVVAILIGVSLLAGIGLLSLLSGALNFLFVKPKIYFLKSIHGKEGFAFGFTWDQNAMPAKMDTIKVQMYNPFGHPTTLEFTRDFDGQSHDFATDVQVGDAVLKMINAKGFETATVEFTVSSSQDQNYHTVTMKGAEFLRLSSSSYEFAEDFNLKNKPQADKAKFSIPTKTFISPPLPKSAKMLKLATNPLFASDFSQGGSAEAAVAKVNYVVSKVWIEPGCIVCNACEGIFPEVFEVTDSTCLIRPGAPLDDGLKIQEAAEACPVEVIKFTKVS